ncbi:MAG: hypothetical protein QNJ27_05190 [Simkaniaceae bacterium]|nr:hypothetical protein [Simkaniaceae bacterium]
MTCQFPLYGNPTVSFPRYSTPDYSNCSPWNLLNYETLSFDRILDFVETIENTDKLEEIFAAKQLEEIEEFLIFLMRNGVRDWDIEAKQRLEEDIAWMRGEPNNSPFAYEEEDDDVGEEFPHRMGPLHGYQGIKIIPASLISGKNPQFVLCGGNFKKSVRTSKELLKSTKKRSL